MSTKEMLYSLIDQMSEAQMKAWLMILGAKSEEVSKNNGIAAFNRLKEMIRPVPELDYDKELEEWREEKFGV
ncbi:MAG: hypothetical protein IJ806_00945 [Ruminococcus sp.]|nr:hypothetical protein [Ruminococcus sp.]